MIFIDLCIELDKEINEEIKKSDLNFYFQKKF